MSDARREILITGVGVHTALGDAPSTWEAVRQGRSALAFRGSAEAPGFPVLAIAPAPPPPLDDLPVDRKLQKYASPSASLALCAAGRALADAGLLGDVPGRARLALFAATGHIGFELAQATRAMSEAGSDGPGAIDGRRLSDGLARCHPLLPFRMLLNMPLGLVSIAYGIEGENAILYPGPLQGATALAMGFDAVASGRCPAALVGASHHGTALFPLALAWRQGRVAEAGGRPEGTACAEGEPGATDAAAFLLLESAEAAGARGARGVRLLEAEAAGEESAKGGAVAELRLAGRHHLLDRCLGQPGPAALPLLVALGAVALRGGAGGRAEAAVRDPDGGAAWAALEAA